MMYTLLAAYVFSRLVSLTQVGAYAGHGLIIISDQNEEIAEALMNELGRGASYIKMTGAYSNSEHQMVYCVIGPNELNLAKRIIERVDPRAFTSVIDVHEAIGEGFTYDSDKQPE